MKLRPDTLAMTAVLAMLTALGPLATDFYLPSLPEIVRVMGTDVAGAQATLSSFDRNGLSEAGALNLAVAEFRVSSSASGAAFDYGAAMDGGRMGPFLVNQLTGSYFTVPDFMDTQHRVEDRDGAEAFLARLSAFGPNLDKALWLAGEVEALCRQYWTALQAGSPVLLDEQQMASVLARFKTYGKQPGELKPSDVPAVQPPVRRDVPAAKPKKKAKKK